MRFEKIVAFAAAVTFIVTIGAAVANGDAIKEDLRKFIEKGDATARDRIKAFNLDATQVADLAKEIHSIVMGKSPDLPAGAEVPIEFPGIDGSKYRTKYYWYCSAPTGDGKKYPLIVIMHSGGGKHDHSATAARELTWWPKPANAIAIAPVCNTEASRNLHWNNDPNTHLAITVLEEALRRFPVDTNRVYLVGASMGGWGGYAVGSLHADRIAGIVSASGGTWIEQANAFPISNLYHVPFYIHHGGQENPKFDREPGPKPVIDLFGKWKKEHGGFELKVVNVEGQGHCMATPKEKQTQMEWLLKQKRDPHPKKVLWKPDDYSYPHFYWLSMEKAAKGPSFIAEIKENTITVTAKNYSSGLKIRLNDKLVDMKKDVTLVVNGQKKFSGPVKPSLLTLVASLQAKKDLEMLFWAEIPAD